MAVNITLAEVPIGPASTFRSTINENFTAIANEIDDIYNTIDTKEAQIYATMVDVRLATEQPTDQKAGDFWFKDLGTSS